MSIVSLRSISGLAAVLSVLLVGLLWVYVGKQTPLSSEEVDRYLERIESQTQVPGGRHDIPELRRFLESDDGQPFYTVNLYEFHERAQYLGEETYEGSGREAFERFSEVMLGLLARRSSHPVFGSEWADSASSGWDRVVIVRYRSRRDIAEVFASPDFAEAGAHKWAALKRNDRMLVQALQIPELHVPLLLLALAGSASALSLWSAGRRRQSPPKAAPR